MAQLLRLHFIQLLQRIQRTSANIAIHAGGIGNIQDRIAFGATLNSLEDGWQESAANELAPPFG
jgi:lipoprotein signal peptidase